MFTLAYYLELFIYSISAFFPFYLTFHCSSNNSLVHACFAPTSFLKIGYYVGLEDFFTFFQEMYSNYSLCQLTPRIKAFKKPLCNYHNVQE